MGHYFAPIFFKTIMFESLSNQQLLVELFGSHYSSVQEDDSLAALFCSQPNPLSRKCQGARELVMRWLKEEIKGVNCLGSPEVVSNYLRLTLCDREHESFLVLFLDNQNGLIECLELFRGTLTQTAVYPREILKCALARNAASVIFAHNHPSGQLVPSQADRDITELLQKALKLVDVRVLDHFIVSGAGLYSFAENGLI
jgi:DNA repair protein RadC